MKGIRDGRKITVSIYMLLPDEVHPIETALEAECFVVVISRKQ